MTTDRVQELMRLADEYALARHDSDDCRLEYAYERQELESALTAALADAYAHGVLDAYRALVPGCGARKDCGMRAVADVEPISAVAQAPTAMMPAAAERPAGED